MQIASGAADLLSVRILHSGERARVDVSGSGELRLRQANRVPRGLEVRSTRKHPWPAVARADTDGPTIAPF